MFSTEITTALENAGPFSPAPLRRSGPRTHKVANKARGLRHTLGARPERGVRARRMRGADTAHANDSFSATSSRRGAPTLRERTPSPRAPRERADSPSCPWPPCCPRPRYRLRPDCRRPRPRPNNWQGVPRVDPRSSRCRPGRTLGPRRIWRPSAAGNRRRGSVASRRRKP